jgi:hypothetical protein
MVLLPRRGMPLRSYATIRDPVPFAALLRVLWVPRPHLGLSLNAVGVTDSEYIGLTWCGRPWRSLLALPEGLFLAGSLRLRPMGI